jgi:hypothetical protein
MCRSRDLQKSRWLTTTIHKNVEMESTLQINPCFLEHKACNTWKCGLEPGDYTITFRGMYRRFCYIVQLAFLIEEDEMRYTNLDSCNSGSENRRMVTTMTFMWADTSKCIHRRLFKFRQGRECHRIEMSNFLSDFKSAYGTCHRLPKESKMSVTLHLTVSQRIFT